MRQKWLNAFVWGMCALIGLATLYGLSAVLTNRPADDNLFRLVNEVLWASAPLVIAVIAALIITRRPDNSIGWLLLVMAAPLPVGTAIDHYLASFGGNPPPPTSLNLALTMIQGIIWLPMIISLVLILLLFPTGKPPSPRWRWLVAAVVGLFFFFLGFGIFINPLNYNDLWTLPNPIGFLSTETVDALGVPWQIGLAIAIVLALISLFVRFRAAGAVERAQIKWMLFACGVLAVVFVQDFFTHLSDSHGLGNDIFSLVMILVVLAIPGAIAVAILRYRLWDIDVLIRKTLLYGALTGLLALVFLGLVVTLQQFLGALTQSENSPLAIVLSTLVIAALFNPLRLRLQAFIDRRFYRSKYDAERTLAALADTLRSETDLEVLSTRLEEVVQEALQPENLSLLLTQPSTRPK